MIQEDAYALGNIIHQEVVTFYESQFNEIFKKCNIYPQYRSFRGNTNIRSKLINPIYNEHEAQLKAKDDEIRRLNNLYADTIKDLGDALIEIERLKAEEILLAIRGTSWNTEEVDEAIAELEKLIEPRMCNGCVYDVVDIPDDTCEDCARTYKDKYTP